MPRIDGVYKNKEQGVGLQFMQTFSESDLGKTGKVEFVLLDNTKKRLKFKFTVCGESLYEITDDKGKHWCFVSVTKDRENVIMNDQGFIEMFEFDYDSDLAKALKKKKKK